MSETIGLSKILAASPLPKIPANLDPEIDNYFRNLHTYLRRLLGLLTDQNITASPNLRIDDVNGFILAPTARDYTLVEYCEFDCELKRITHKLTSGGCTVAVKVNGSSLAGSGDNTPSSSQGTYTFSANSVSEGDRIQLTVSGISSPVDLAFTLKRERQV